MTEDETPGTEVRRLMSIISVWNEILKQIINSWSGDRKNLKGYTRLSSTLRGWGPLLCYQL